MLVLIPQSNFVVISITILLVDHSILFGEITRLVLQISQIVHLSGMRLTSWVHNPYSPSNFVLILLRNVNHLISQSKRKSITSTHFLTGEQVISAEFTLHSRCEVTSSGMRHKPECDFIESQTRSRGHARNSRCEEKGQARVVGFTRGNGKNRFIQFGSCHLQIIDPLQIIGSCLTLTRFYVVQDSPKVSAI